MGRAVQGETRIGEYVAKASWGVLTRVEEGHSQPEIDLFALGREEARRQLA